VPINELLPLPLERPDLGLRPEPFLLIPIVFLSLVDIPVSVLVVFLCPLFVNPCEVDIFDNVLQLLSLIVEFLETGIDSPYPVCNAVAFSFMS